VWICYLYIVELVEKPTQISFCSVKLNVTDMSYSSWFKRNKNSLHLICLSPIIVLLLWVRLPLWARSTTLCDQVGQWLATGRWFSPGPSTNKTDRHHITEILLKVALNTIKPTQTIHLLLNTRDMWVSEWVSEWLLLNARWTFYSAISMVRTSYISMRWWCPLCTKLTPTPLVVFV
jgi:hypothetical protein